MHGSYVNTIRFFEFKGEEQKDHEVASLLKIAKYCLNVERVLMNPEEVAMFCKALHQVGIAGLWNRIRELPQNLIELVQNPTFTQIVPLFAKSLETADLKITLNHMSTTRKLIEQKLDCIGDYLRHFHYITKASILLNKPRINVQLMDAFFDKIPVTIKSFKIDALGEMGHIVEEDQNILAVLPIEKNNHLESLQATLPILNANTIEYVLEKFPLLSSLTLIRSKRSADNARFFDISRTLLNRIMEVNTFELKNLNPTTYSLLFDILMRERNAVKELVLTNYSASFQRDEFNFILDIKKYTKDGAKNISIVTKSNQLSHSLNRELSSIEMFCEMELLEEYGAFLETLVIYNLTRGKHWNEFCMVSNLAQKCPHLKTLIFAGEDLIGIDRKMKARKSRAVFPCIPNHSVKILLINQQHNISSISTHLSRQFPNLYELIIAVRKKAPEPNLCLLDAYDSYRHKYCQKDVWIEMPYSQLNCVHLQYKMELKAYRNHLMYIRLQTDSKIRFFYCLDKFTPGTETLFIECTQIQFSDLLFKTWSHKIAYCSIKCKSLKKLLIESDSYQRIYSL